MSAPSWWTDSPPWAHVIPSDAPTSPKEALPPSGSIFVARMQGQDMLDADGVFTQFYEHLRLPDYFGWNWDALNDCLSDLHWITARRYLLIVDDSEYLLSQSPDERPILLRILLKSAEHWARKPDFPGQPKSVLRTIFLCRPDLSPELQEEFSRIQDMA
ncbi:barstar family protein [Streptomyces sp. CC224B]|uniref:barstar family protein n=1 Tax=Streptomyces sp. CC224B TaxID=3044571 RepID=UPI0024A93D07|nr:barstar family protein [Streptomyces sp. CC224B]